MAFFVLTGIARAEYTAEQTKALADLRSTLAARQLTEIAPQLAKLNAMQGDDKFQAEVARLELLAKYVQGFWEAVDKGAKAALTMGELDVDDKTIAIVDYDRRLFIIRMEGENKRYTINNIPAKLALEVAQQHLKKDLPNNKVYFGAFLAMDGRGSRKLARQYWDEAARGKADVQSLLPELDTPQISAPIHLPKLTPAQQAILQPAQWQLRKKERMRLTRDSLGKRAKQTSEGRLEVTAVKDEESQVVTKFRVTGDFRCIIFFQDLPKDQRFGLYGGAVTDEPVTVPLPEGDVKVDFRRVKGEFSCKVNEVGVEIKATAKGATLSGNLGVTTPNEGTVIIAGFELDAQ